jgi:aryl-alcohol dehydrogenase-like predicted oxidoreductase
MQYRILGASGVRVSTLCLGTAFFGIRPAGRDVDAIVGRALDAGVNFIDTANSYGNQSRFDRSGYPTWRERPSSEECVGRAIRGRRDRVIVATKVQERVGDGPNDGGPTGGGLTRRHIVEQCERSLLRLGTDWIDLYYAHHVDPTTPIDQTLRAFDDLVSSGKVRYIGLSNFSGWELTRAHGLCDRRGWVAPVALEMPYNLANRWIEREVIPACQAHDVAITCYSPLEAGLLTGEITAERPAGDPRRVRRGGQACTPAQVALGTRLVALAHEWGTTPASLALSWLVGRPGVTSVILGPEVVADLDAGLTGVEHTLDNAQRTVLDSLSLN